MGLVDLVREINFANQVMSVAAVVTRPAPDDEPIETRGIWITPASEDVPLGSTFPRREPIRIMALRRDDVPAAPEGTVIVAPEKPDEDDETWVVDGHDRHEADHYRVIVRRHCELA